MPHLNPLGGYLLFLIFFIIWELVRDLFYKFIDVVSKLNLNSAVLTVIF